MIWAPCRRDHFTYFSVLYIMKKKDHKPIFVAIRNNDATSFALFQNEVASAMASHVYENDLFGDPNKIIAYSKT